jgi:hypothetical protein
MEGRRFEVLQILPTLENTSLSTIPEGQHIRTAMVLSGQPPPHLHRCAEVRHLLKSASATLETCELDEPAHA